MRTMPTFNATFLAFSNVFAPVRISWYNAARAVDNLLFSEL